VSKHKLLLADDSVTIQKVVNLTFADEGIEVISVGDGNAAMEKFVEATPDLVMVDVNMPGVDGYRICEIIKQDETTKHVPVILLVGSFEPFDENEARRVGANDYLTKPFQSIRQLVNKVTVLLNKSNGNEVSAPPVAETPPAEIPLQKQAEEVAELSIYKQAEEVAEPLGDPGMDDDMIQANQIGSLPVDDIQKLETNVTDFEINLPDNQLKTPYSEPSNQQNFESEEDFGKTQPLSADEFKELTSLPVEEEEEFEDTLPMYSDERISAEERAMSLEKQMVSEFESEAKKMSSDFELQAKESVETSTEMPSPQPVAQEETFILEEVVVRNQSPIEEIPEEKGFEIQQIESVDKFAAEELAPQIQPVAEADTILEELYNAPEESKVEEVIKEEYYSEPKLVEVQEFKVPETVSQPIDLTPVQPFVEQVSAPEPERIIETSSETAPIFEPKEETSDWERFEEKSNFQPEVVETPFFESAETTVEETTSFIESPKYFQDESISDEPENVSEAEQTSESETLPVNEQISSEIPKISEPIQFYPVEQFFERDQPSTDFEDTIEKQEVSNFTETETSNVEIEAEQTVQPESRYLEPEEETEPSYTETETSDTEFETVTEPEQTFESETEVAEFKSTDESEQSFDESAQSYVEEPSTPTIEIPAPFPTIEEVIPSIEEEEQPLEVESKEAEKTEAKVDTLVSKKDTSEAVESVIVSEFARHSISLSSEAVEKIASRIADKISEKIIERMADDVVGSLADLIVEKMERKKLE
jgi:DNA-binding response OmpR family regulator